MAQNEDYTRDCKFWSNNLISGIKTDSWPSVLGMALLSSPIFFGKGSESPICHKDELKEIAEKNGNEPITQPQPLTQQ